MERLSNDQGIQKIIMKPIAYTKCVIGKDWYKNELEIVFIPDDCYPDYMEVEAWIEENVDGKELNIEDVVNTIHSFLVETYKPIEVEVTDHIKGCRTHFDVIVTK